MEPIFEETARKLDGAVQKLGQVAKLLDLPKLRKNVADREAETAAPAFWHDSSLAKKKSKELNDFKKLLGDYEKTVRTLDDLKAHLELAKEVGDAGELREVEKGLGEAERMVQAMDVRLKLSGEFDRDDAIISLHAGAGGTEACDWCEMLFRMYSRYAERKDWRLEVMNTNATGLGGFKEITFKITGESVYSQLKFEGGVHRVQRVPTTEAQGRIHTSAVTVAVLPEADAVEVALDANDLQIDVYRSSGPGGQSVNTTDSAVRVTHKPSGLVVTCQDEKSQHKNKAKALMILRSRLLAHKIEEEASARSADRRNQVGSGDRSERIRTYNFPQNRLTDHRINLTLYRLEAIAEGDIQDIVDALIAADRARRLAEA